MFSGYLKNPEATAKDLNDDGWFFSGDLCIQDEQGRVKINGRKKEILIRGGINISANEVDNNLDGCPESELTQPSVCLMTVWVSAFVPSSWQKGDVVPTLDSIAGIP